MLRKLIVLPFLVMFGAPAYAIDVAISFEDAPNPPTPLLGDERPKLLLESLGKAQVEQALFLIVGRNFETQGRKSLARYASAGHVLASQGYSQKTVDELGPTDFVRDMKQNDLLLRDLPGYQMWFRFPYLSEGSSVAARDEVRVWIYHMLYGRAQVTIDSPDAAIDAIVQDGVRAGRHLNLDHLRQFYVSVLMECVQHYDELAVRVLGHSPRHMLRLHENDLAALFIVDFAAALRASGGKIVRATDALNDDFNAQEADVVPLQGSHVIAIAKERGITGAVPAAIERRTELEAALTRANIWQ